MADVLNRLREIVPEPQREDGVTYAHKIDKAEARIDFAKSAKVIERQVRAFNPAPGAFFELNGERIKILEASAYPEGGMLPGSEQPEPGTVVNDELWIACGKRFLLPRLVQRAGKGVMSVDELLRGFPIPAGTRLG